MKSQLVIVCMIVAVVICVEVDKCDDETPGAVDFASAGCDVLPCPLVRGTISDSNITFRIPADTDTSTIKVHSWYGIPIWIEYPLPDPNVCHNLINSYCPLEENEIVTYHLGIKILEEYPKISMTLRIKILNENKKTIMCMKVPAVVVDP